MTATLFVNLAVVSFIAWIVWYFFLSQAVTVAVAHGAGGIQELEVVVKGGYTPDVIRAQPNVPLRLRFRREETSACSDEIVFPDFGLKRALPAFETTVIDIPASPPGSYGFACGMDMLHGTLVLGDVEVETGVPQSQKRSCCGGVTTGYAKD